MNEILKVYVIGNGANVDTMENETLEQQTNCHNNNFARFVESASENQVMESSNDD